MFDGSVMREAIRMSVLFYYNDSLLEQGVITNNEHAEIRASYRKQENELLERVRKTKRGLPKGELGKTMR